MEPGGNSRGVDNPLLCQLKTNQRGLLALPDRVVLLVLHADCGGVGGLFQFVLFCTALADQAGVLVTRVLQEAADISRVFLKQS